MANKPLKSITFPGLTDKYTVPQIDNTLAVSGAAADAKKTGDEITNLKADLNAIGWKTRTLCVITGTGKYANQSSGYSYIYKLVPNSEIILLNTKGSGLYTILKSLGNLGVSGGSPDYATGFSGAVAFGMGNQRTVQVPNDGNYIWLYGNDPGQTTDKYLPDYIFVNSVDVTQTIANGISEAIGNLILADKTPSLNSRNYFDATTLTDNFYVQASTGKTVSSEYFKATDHLRVTGKKIGVSRGIAQFAFYDINKRYISGVQIVTSAHDFTEYDIPAKAFYVRFSLDKTYDDTKANYTFTNGDFLPFDYLVIDSDNSKMPDFSRLRDGIAFAVQFPNSKVVVKNGVYNLLSEFATEISNQQNTQYGLGIGNGITVFAESGTVINCLYTDSDPTVITNLSPFYTLRVDGGFTLENIEVHSSNCRYCVHDEYSGSDVVVKNTYKNCKFFHDGTGAGSLLGYYPQCIGGGCAKHSYVTIEGCYFYTKEAENAVTPLVSYHNASSANAQSNINVNGCYFDDKGTFECSYYGNTELVSQAIVNNCSLGANPYVRSQSGTWPQNFELLSFNNDIRT